MLPDNVLEKLKYLNFKQQTAFATGCVYRIFDLYFDLAEPYNKSFWKTIEMGWEIVKGNDINTTQIKNLHTTLDKESLKYVNEDDVNIVYILISASKHLLNTMLEANESAQSAFHTANIAAESVDNVESLSESDSTEGIIEEEGWQLEWLKYCSLNNPINAQEECENRCQASPKWYLRFES